MRVVGLVVENLITRDNLKHNVEKEHIFTFSGARTNDDGYSYLIRREWKS